ncbi:MAG: 16S rRNA (adenine(1518)-N(6)/adenine(1519)-N(6))-dimethyltransferase RsmA [Bacilli bacterium]|nr:16S rRNA (adenine(1518)-N(6)/adenine(1519)-N(6))-dimethyltransferase RsmA [Bacilli bacterium]
MEYSPKKMQKLLEDNAFGFKKKFGQNFIIDENVINSIVDKSEIDKETLVIEIGPGAGSLTYGLATKAKNVLCYEIDTTLKDILNSNLSDFSNVDVIYEDFLKVDVNNELKKYDYNKLYVVANLPYYITTPIILKLIEDKIPVDKIVVMVQKEVGDRFKAKPGTKDYGSLSIFLKYYFEVNKILDVSRNVFMPKPNVDSIVVEFKKVNSKIDVKNEELFFKIVKESFTQKRKTLRNNLKGYDLEKINEVLAKHGYDLSVRAEQLTIEVFADIANSL